MMTVVLLALVLGALGIVAYVSLTLAHGYKKQPPHITVSDLVASGDVGIHL